MSIKLQNHKVNPVNDRVDIEVIDEPGAGGAHHKYVVSWPSEYLTMSVMIPFQNGPIAEKGVNGLTQEVLLAIVEHRLQCFQEGAYACAENATALDHVRNAMNILKSRTLARMQRGVEGTSVK